MVPHSSFAPAYRLLPPRQRDALAALHHFCRAADESVDAGGESQSSAAARLHLWRREVDALYGAGSPATAQGRGLAPFVSEFGFQRADFDRLLEALAEDARGVRFLTSGDLERYCEGVASSPGYLALAIFGCPQARAYAHRLGLALQLTNILRDARRDLSAGRLYLPAEDLARFGLAPEDLLAPARPGLDGDDRLRRLMAFERNRAQEWFGESERAYRAEPGAARRRLAAARAMERLYRALLAALRLEGPLPRRRVRPGRLRALAAVAAAWREARAVPG